MDLFEEYTSPAALPLALTFNGADPAPQQQPSQDAFILHEVPPEQGVRETTKQQWETLKPLIKRIYIDENKPFPYLARVLREEHQFEATKRQFARQVEKWGFRKNVSSSERRQILQSLAGAKHEAVPELQDHRLKAGKLENWKRRYRVDIIEGSRTVGKQREWHVSAHHGAFIRPDSVENMDVVQSILNAERELSNVEIEFAEGENRHASQPLETYITLGSQKESNCPAMSSEVPEDALSMDTSQDSWPFDWSKVDIPGSPGLSRLFKGLKLDAAAHVPQLSLDEPEPDDRSCVSLIEIQDGFRENADMVTEYWSSQMQLAGTSPHKSSGWQYPQYPWRDIENVYCGYSTSPLTEVYVFPPSTPSRRSHKCRGVNTLSWTELITQEGELETRLAKLRAHLLEENPTILAVMERLVDVSMALGKYKKAELIERKVADIYRRKFGPENIKVWDSFARVADYLRMQGHLPQAQCLSDEIRSELRKLGRTSHQLDLDVVRVAGALALELGRYDDSERLRREALQMTLSAYGPRHWRTMKAISVLGVTITALQKRGGDVLARTAVQLCLEELDEHDAVSCDVMNASSWVLNKTNASEECYNLSTKALEQFTPHYGPTQQQVLGLEEQRAWSMLDMGQLAESESLYRHLLSRYIETNRKDQSNVYSGLGNVLCEMCRFEEATVWYEKSFQFRFETFGVTHPVLIETCYQLSDCCEDQGRFEDALEFYEKMIGKIQEAEGDNDGIIAKLEAEVSRVEENLRRQSNISSGSEDDFSSDSTGDSEEQDATDESIDDEDDDFVREEEMWMAED